MRSSLIVIIWFVLTIGFTSAQSNHAPIIVNNNPNFIEDYINPVTLNWTVTDDNLRISRIYQGLDLINEQNFTINEMISIDVTIHFTLGRGSYNFSILVIDADGNIRTNSLEIIKGTDVEDDLLELNELDGFPLIMPLTILIILSYSTRINTKKHNAKLIT